MTKLKLFTAALAASACFASQAIAADMYDPASMKDAPIAAPMVYSWTGFYIGAGLGGSFVDYGSSIAGSFDGDPLLAPGPDTLSALADDGEGALFGTLQLGLDRQLHSRFVAGLFADYDFKGDSETSFAGTVALASAVGDLSVAGTAEVDDSWTIGGRIGLLANPSLLVYGLVGWTHADLNVSGVYSTTVVGGVPVAFSAEDELDAVTIGAGVEAMLRPGLSLKFEYRYTDFDGLSVTSDLAAAGAAGAVGSSTVDIDTDMHTARAVLTWRPDWGSGSRW